MRLFGLFFFHIAPPMLQSSCRADTAPAPARSAAWRLHYLFRCNQTIGGARDAYRTRAIEDSEDNSRRNKDTAIRKRMPVNASLPGRPSTSRCSPSRVPSGRASASGVKCRLSLLLSWVRTVSTAGECSNCSPARKTTPQLNKQMRLNIWPLGEERRTAGNLLRLK